MLVPAILHRDQIYKEFQRYFYTEAMMFETGSLNNWVPEIYDCPEGSICQYAILDNEERVIGYLGFTINYYSSKVYNFGLFSFDPGNIIIGKDVFEKLEELTKRFHRVEWRMVGGNHAERSYDHFCFSHGGNKHVLRDAIRDKDGKYRDDIIYEIINDNV